MSPMFLFLDALAVAKDKASIWTWPLGIFEPERYLLCLLNLLLALSVVDYRGV